MPNGGYGDVPTEHEVYEEKLRWIHHNLEGDYALEYKTYQCYKGILLVLERMAKLSRFSVEDNNKALELVARLEKLMIPKRWWQFWR